MRADTLSTPPPDDRRRQLVACAAIAAGAWILFALFAAALTTYGRTAGTVTLPVVFHVAPCFRVSDDAIREQLSVTSRDFAPTRVRFELAGVDRPADRSWCFLPAFPHRESLLETAEAAMKRSTRRGGKETVNVWLVGLPDGDFGWSTPPRYYAEDAGGDGVVVDYRTLPHGALEGYNEGRTLTHELGHFFGLEHAEVRSAGAPLNCPSGNFMSDTVGDVCMNDFTLAQIRTINRWAEWRAGGR